MYCPQCGVEVDDELPLCPLCRGTLDTQVPQIHSRYPAHDHGPGPPLGAEGQRRIVFDIGSFLLLVPMFVSVAVDASLSGRLTWSLRCVVGLLAAWGYLSLLIFVTRRRWLLLVLALANTALLLVALDALDGRVEWFLDVGVAALGGVALLVLAVGYLARRSFSSMLSTTAAALIGAGLLSLELDIAISWHRRGVWIPTWSVAVGLALLPPAVFLLYLHRRLRPRIDLEKFFHW